jgi:hypothetical protein
MPSFIPEALKKIKEFRVADYQRLYEDAYRKIQKKHENSQKKKPFQVVQA